MPFITKASNVVGSTFVVTLCELDQNKSTISFTLRRDNQQIFFLNLVSSSLKHQTCESCNVFVYLPKCTCKKLIQK